MVGISLFVNKKQRASTAPTTYNIHRLAENIHQHQLITKIYEQKNNNNNVWYKNGTSPNKYCKISNHFITRPWGEFPICEQEAKSINNQQLKHQTTSDRLAENIHQHPLITKHCEQKLPLTTCGIKREQVQKNTVKGETFHQAPWGPINGPWGQLTDPTQ